MEAILKPDAARTTFSSAAGARVGVEARPPAVIIIIIIDCSLLEPPDPLKPMPVPIPAVMVVTGVVVDVDVDVDAPRTDVPRASGDARKGRIIGRRGSTGPRTSTLGRT